LKKDVPVDNSINNDLNGVLVSQKMNDLHGVLYDAYSHQLLTVVATVHHEGVGQPLNDRALGLPEALNRVAPSSVRHECGMLVNGHSNVIGQRDIIDLVNKTLNIRSSRTK
jgi:hypothetical protein